MESPCVECRFYSHTNAGVYPARNDYIFKMKDLSGFSGKAEENQASSQPTQTIRQVQMVTISEEEADQRIDNFLLRTCKGVPKSHIYRVLRSGEVRVNKGRVDQTYRLRQGDVVRLPPLRLPDPQAKASVPGTEFAILHEDSHVLVIDKPAGVAVHGGSGVSYGVIEQLRAARPEAKFLELVHRLDRDTSGILMLAKKRSALNNLHDQIREGTIDKRYLTLVHGDWRNSRQHVKLALHKYNTADGERRVRVQADGLASHTIFNLRRKLGEYALLEAELKTGRTHQIRVHLASSGFPIVGDDKYGDFGLNRALQKAIGDRIAFRRMFLHAWRLTFRHPESGQAVTLEAGLPDECVRFVHNLAALSERQASEAGPQSQ
jgi:23S rRNA pseudouridine955/2504/2580 synthase